MENAVALLGVKGGPAIRPGSNMPTSTLVTLGGKHILVDAGLGAARGVCDQGVNLPELDAILITHLHSDHYLELGPLLHTAWTAGLKRVIPVYGPPKLRDYWDAFLVSMEYDIRIRVADEGRPELASLVDLKVLEGAFSIGNIDVSLMENDHPPVTPSYAFRLNAAGCSVVLSGDTAPMDEMVSFAKGADLLVHEAMLLEGVDALIAKTPNGDDRLKAHILHSHTPAAEVGRIATEAGVQQLALNHYVPDGLPGFAEDHWRAAIGETWAGPLVVGCDGTRIVF